LPANNTRSTNIGVETFFPKELFAKEQFNNYKFYISGGDPYMGFNCCVQRINVARRGNSRKRSAPV